MRNLSLHPPWTKRLTAFALILAASLLLANLGPAGAKRQVSGYKRADSRKCDVAHGKRASKNSRVRWRRAHVSHASRGCRDGQPPVAGTGPSLPAAVTGLDSGRPPAGERPPVVSDAGHGEAPGLEVPAEPKSEPPAEPGKPEPEAEPPVEPEPEEPGNPEPEAEPPAEPGEPEAEAELPEEPSEPGEPEEPANPDEGEAEIAPVSARAQEFGGQAAAVALTFNGPAGPSDASRCVGIDSSGAGVDFGGVDQGSSPEIVQLELAPGGGMPARVSCPVEGGARTLGVSAASASDGGVVDDPIDSRYLTQVPFGRRSFWIQPWRAYLDTWPASRLLDAVGINFNVRPREAEGTARLLQSSGFKLARIELSWNLLSYDDPTRFTEEPEIRKRLVALREHGLRPLILLNANSGGPGPARPVTLTTLEPAAAGAGSVKLTSASADLVVPGKTGFSGLSFGGAPDILIESVDAGGVARLSRPLPGKLAAGDHEGATLRYAPFGPPRLSNGEPNPVFQATLGGWLRYVGTVSEEAESVFGAGGYDLEVWNELSFGSQFLDQANYYSPPRESGFGSVTGTLLDETVAYVRDPDNGISPQVGISDGFAGQTPFASGASVPAGTTALSKHLYRGPQYLPRNSIVNSILPLDALGRSDATTNKAPFKPRFTPSYASALPEYFLTATQTETVVRDLAPITTSIYGTPHGREVGPAGGAPAQTWMTEYNLNTNTLFPLSPENSDLYIGTATAAEKESLQARIVLRSLVSMAGKGMARIYFYAAAHAEGYSLISDKFIDALGSSDAYPGDQLGGDTMDAVRNLVGQFEGPGPDGAARQLELDSIVQQGNHAEFSGDGTAAHPDLYDRDLLAVLPFQSSPTRFVVPIYVMTPNLTTVYQGSANRFDLPDENFRITLGNLPASSRPPSVSAYDPIRDCSTPARFVSRQGSRAIFEVAATNYPRLLTIDYPDG
jgi:hypothetical protein